MNRENAGEHHRQTDGPEVSTQKSLGEEKNIEMERAVIIRRVVTVEAVFDHLVHEPPVDSLIEMGRFDPEKEEPEKGAERNDRPGSPIDRPGSVYEAVQPGAKSGRNRWRGLRSAASNRSDAHSRYRWLWIHREQLYSVYSGTLQARVREQRRCPHLRGKPRQPGRRGRGTWRALRIFQSRYREFRPDGRDHDRAPVLCRGQLRRGIARRPQHQRSAEFYSH